MRPKEIVSQHQILTFREIYDARVRKTESLEVLESADTHARSVLLLQPLHSICKARVIVSLLICAQLVREAVYLSENVRGRYNPREVT